MEGLVAKRSACRGAFTQACNRIEESLREASTVQNVEIWKTQLRSKYERLEAVQEEISAFILTDKGLVNTYEEDFGKAEKYRDKYDALSINLDRMTAKAKEVVTEKRKFQLPTIKLTAFSGDPREYLGFWAQFQKIHEDQQIAEEDKFQYLLQAVIPDSKAARLVQSIPPTRDNYPKVIEQLRDRFGRDDLLVQIFVRDLLAMITKNISSGNKKCDLAELYDAIESKLSALESLGRTKEKYADFLAPLVESCLPETVLRAWERSRSSDDSAVRSLEQLMLFLRNEVKGEEMILLARSGLGAQRTSIRTTQNSDHDMPTISALVDTSDMAAGKRTYLCIFCNKTHDSANCFSARRMSLEDRKRVVMKHRACFKCLRVGHTARKCRVKVQCFKCDRSHVTLMCAEGETSVKESVSGTLPTNVLASQCSNNVFLQTLMIMVAFRDKELVIRCLLDSGCQRSYITKRVIEVLGIPYKQKQTISHGLFGGRETSPRTHFVYDLQLKSLDGTYACNIEVLSESKICGAVPRVSDISTIIELKERGIVIPDLNSQESEISALIGADFIGNLITGKSLRLNSGLVVLQTRLGNVLFGKVKAMPFDNCIESVPASSESLYCKSYSVLSLFSCASFDLSDLWNLENIGITHPVEDNKRKVAYVDTVNSFKEILTVLPNGRYQVSLPFKGELKLPTNRNLVSGRHRNMCLRAIQGSYLNDYVNVFKEWEELGIVERVPKEELELGYHYLAHRPIIRHSSQTMKIRPVFDASARAGNGPSLNDLLIRGPNLIELIPDILDRFRLYPVGLSSDIEKAFLQIVIAPQHRNYLRFLWPTIDEEVVYRHCRLVFGLSPSPFLLAASLSHLLDSASPELDPVVQKLRHSFYVDNCVTGVSNAHEQENFILKATEILAERCFNLRGWESNVPSRFVRSSGVTSLLGVLWDLEKDTLKCSVDIHLDEEPTKRKVLAAVQRIFDPIGILCPSTLVPKIMLQEMWKAKVGWDNLLPENFQALFLKWVKEAESFRTVEVPRYLNVNESSELHVFVDACRTSYAACIFVRTETSLGVKVQLIRAKTRVAPIKELTIPRLELMACCIGARLAHAVKNALELPKLNLVFWSDSMVALWWLLKKGSWSVFVENRIKEVKQLFPNEVWRHVPGQQNPADLLSRGCSPQLLGESLWWEGPSWLYEPCERWPKNELVCQESSINIERGKVQLCGVGLIEDTIPWYAVRFSGFLSIIRCVGWICRFAHNSRGSREKRRSGELSTLEICFAERTLIRMIQKQYFPEACMRW